MQYPWETFFKEKVTKIFTEKKHVIDIGGGLRALREKGNRYSQERSWIAPLIQRVDYKILDTVSDYHPDIVGDIHALPFHDNACEAIFCLAVLEHVENPIQACEELYRVLSPGGYCLVYVPFLYYYHAHTGYYKDYWRFTKDTFQILFQKFSSMEMQNVRGALLTWLHISPLGKYALPVKFFYFLDSIFHKQNSNQTSGYYIFLTK